MQNIIPSHYILSNLKDLCKNGDAYVSEDALYQRCHMQDISFQSFQADLLEQICLGCIHREDSRLYSTQTWRYEESAAKSLTAMFHQPALPPVYLPYMLSVNGLALCEEQRRAVALALSNRLSLILGGAGCGKSTLIRAIVNMSGVGYNFVLCAPTGKAAQNLQNRTGLLARTVHSALGMHPNKDILAPVIWNTTQLVIVDEASMMTLEMLAGILHRVTSSCRVVLLGDPNQLLSVGSGNVLPDLLELGVPCAYLALNHRQNAGAAGLLHNVVEFSRLHHQQDLSIDESFSLRPMWEGDVQNALTEEAIHRFLAGESLQVLSPYNQGYLSVQTLNHIIRDRVNPLEPGKQILTGRCESFREGDRVIILQNDRNRGCNNGDVGIFHILYANSQCISFCVELPDGRRPTWYDICSLEVLSLAYVLTVHKAQGSGATRS